MNEQQNELEHQYRQVLAEYCKTHSEDALYEASLLSSSLIQHGMGPDEIVALHYDGMQSVARDESLPHSERIRILNDSHQFLLEIMIAYGAQYKEYLDLRLSDAIRRAENAEVGQREKLEILAMIAHELGNPLTIALGNMQLAVRFLEAEDLSNLRDLVHDSREALQRLAALTAQLVVASRGDEPALKRARVDLMRVATRVETLERRLAETKNIELSLLSETSPIWITGDEEALNSILDNLVSNALRYTRSGGTVTISVENRSSEAVLTVSDTGVGMTEESLSHIFDQFYRAEQARIIEPKGLGMGLNIVDRLVRGHYGRIEVESELGRGTTFRVFLPKLEERVDGT